MKEMDNNEYRNQLSWNKIHNGKHQLYQKLFLEMLNETD